MNALLVFAALSMAFLTVKAQEIQILRGADPAVQASLAEIAARVTPGTVVVMGENHGFETAQKAQVQLMQALRGAQRKVSVGLEFFYYPQQDLVDAYRQGGLAEADFLQRIQWGKPAFSFYRDQAIFPRYELGERTLALNAPRTLTGAIAQKGLAGLSAEEKALLPPGFTVGRASYKERFLATMPHLPSPDAGDRYFEAQSTWDDTMAWRASEFMAAHPDQVLMIVVGDFHAQYGGGLPDRLEARMGKKPLVFSYVNSAGLSPDQVSEQLSPSGAYGPRGDYIWLVHEEPNKSSTN